MHPARAGRRGAERGRPSGSRPAPGAAVLAAAHDVAILPIYVSGTREAMPPGRSWPKRLRAGMIFHRYPISVRFGPPIRPLDGEHRNETMARVQAWFDAQEGGGRDGGRAASPRTPASSADARRPTPVGSR